MPNRYKDKIDAIEKAKQIYQTAVANGNKFPLIPVAQAVLESAWFQRESGKNNFFGQKATNKQPGRNVLTKEEIAGKMQAMQQRFRDYDSVEESIKDHLNKWQSIYNDADTLEEALTKLSPKYATDSKYAEKVKSVMYSLKKRGIGESDTYLTEEKKSPDVIFSKDEYNQIVNVNPKRATRYEVENSPKVEEEFNRTEEAKQAEKTLSFKDALIKGTPIQEEQQTINTGISPIGYDLFVPQENEFYQYFQSGGTFLGVERDNTAVASKVKKNIFLKKEEAIRKNREIEQQISKQLRKNVPTIGKPSLKGDGLEESRARMEAIHDRGLTALDRPLVYLSDPNKMVGDIASAMGFQNHNFPTSEIDRQKINERRYTPGNDIEESIYSAMADYLPGAAFNVALGAATAEIPSVGNVLREVAGLPKKTAKKAVDTYIEKREKKLNKKIEDLMSDFHSVTRKEREKITSREGIRRIKEIGLDPHKVRWRLENMNVSNNIGEGSFSRSPMVYKNGNINLPPFVFDNTAVINVDGKQILTDDALTHMSPSSVFAHEVAHTLQQEDLVKSFPIGMLRELENPRALPTDIDRLLSNLEFKSAFKKVSRDKYNFGELSNEQGAADYFWRGKNRGELVGEAGVIPSEGVEKFAFLREMRQEMVDKGFIDDIYSENITPELIGEFMKKHPKNRIASFSKNNADNRELLSYLMKIAPAATGIAAGVTAEQNKFQSGGEVTQQQIEAFKKYRGNQSMYLDEGSQAYKDWVEKDKYYNPKKDNITSGDPAMDFLYKNDWLFNVPGINSFLKEQAYKAGKNSAAQTSNLSSEDILKGKVDNKYTGLQVDGDYVNNANLDLVSQYIYGDQNLPRSKYKPTSDYYEFLPSYSLKGDYDKRYATDEIYTRKMFDEMLKAVISSKYEYNHEKNDGTWDNNFDESYAAFLKKKKPVYKTDDTSRLDRAAREFYNADLGGYKIGAAWDEERNLPYISISDAWDFEPTHYAKKWGNEQATLLDSINPEKTKIQAHLMHKAGKPFKIYDRFYFNPETRQYIPDSEIEKRKKK